MDPMTVETGYATGRARRERIIAEATRLYAQVGFHAATTLAVAAQCGISRAGLLHHFPTRESLLQAVLEERDRQEMERFRANGSGQRDGLGVLRGMIDLVDFNSKQFGIAELYAVLSAEATAPNHPAHTYFVERYRRIRAGTAWALGRAQAEGLLVEGIDIADMAIELTSFIDGLQLQWLLSPGEVDMALQVKKRLQRIVTVPL
jgi:AcrR family transcriptional regulator